MYVNRSVEQAIAQHFRGKSREGALVPGIVGCGKTTMITHLLSQLAGEFECFSFTGDEIAFRSAVAQSSGYILDYIQSRTAKKALVFIDEVQKEEAIFDAVKIAFDQGNISFIISGSNPEFIRTKATTRIQRRGRLFEMQPFSLPEILISQNLLSLDLWRQLQDLLSELLLGKKELPNIEAFAAAPHADAIEKVAKTYLIRGGLPLAWQAASTAEALQEVKKVYERGFEPILYDTSHVSNTVAQALGHTHGQEFSYQGVMQRSRMSQRRLIVDAINALMAHGYLYQKQPTFFEVEHRSYLSVYSYCDPGIVSYLQATLQLDGQELGPRVEGVCHARLHALCGLLPVKSQLNYYKPFVTSGSSVRMLSGEIDFVIQVGKRIIPIEAKHGANVTSHDVPHLLQLVRERNLPYGIVLYGGKAKLDQKNRLIYLPWYFM